MTQSMWLIIRILSLCISAYISQQIALNVKNPHVIIDTSSALLLDQMSQACGSVVSGINTAIPYMNLS